VFQGLISGFELGKYLCGRLFSGRIPQAVRPVKPVQSAHVPAVHVLAVFHKKPLLLKGKSMDARNCLQPFPDVRGQFVKPFDLFKPVRRHGGIIEKKMSGSSRERDSGLIFSSMSPPMYSGDLARLPDLLNDYNRNTVPFSKAAVSLSLNPEK
jgi:hypothetical protein